MYNDVLHRTHYTPDHRAKRESSKISFSRHFNNALVVQ